MIECVEKSGYIEDLRNEMEEEAMSNIDAIKVIENEVECVKRANHCNRDCSNCDLVREDFEILNAYKMAIYSLKYNNKHRKAYKRFKNKYIKLKLIVRRALNEIWDMADADAYSDYDLGINYGLMLAYDIFKKHIKGNKEWI